MKRVDVVSRWGGFVAGVLVLALVCACSLTVGAEDIPWRVALAAMTEPAALEHHHIVRDLRLPRTALCLVVGMCLAVAGALIQAFTRNPLADPGILGVNAGATLAIVLAVTGCGFTATSEYIWFALLGAFLATAAVYFIGGIGKARFSPVAVTLAGVALGAVLTGLAVGVMLANPSTFDNVRVWQVGSVASRDGNTIWSMLPFMVTGLGLAAYAAHSLNALALGEDLAHSLGASVSRTRLVVVMAVTLLAGAATAAVGPIAFVGMMVPHAARFVTGPTQPWIVAYSCVFGGLLMVLSDMVGRVVVRPAELPVGVVTAFVGAPVLIALVRSKRLAAL